MADDILTQLGSAAPPLDTVLIWLTTTVERDLVERGVFPTLRSANAMGHRASSSLHYLTEDQAQAVLADALHREQQACKGLKTAYKGHVKSLRCALAQAFERPAIFSEPVLVCTQQSSFREIWRGTKQQLQAHGIKRSGPWPGEPGGKENHVRAKDARGYHTSLSRYSSIWPGLFEANITIPYSVRAQPTSSTGEDERAKMARLNLEQMPKSVEEFRAHVVHELRWLVRIPLKRHCSPSTYHGFHLADGLMELVDEAFDNVVQVICEAQIHFDAALQKEVEQRYRSEFASADSSFQSKMTDLLRPNPSLLVGGTS